MFWTLFLSRRGRSLPALHARNLCSTWTGTYFSCTRRPSPTGFSTRILSRPGGRSTRYVSVNMVNNDEHFSIIHVNCFYSWVLFRERWSSVQFVGASVFASTTTSFTQRFMQTSLRNSVDVSWYVLIFLCFLMSYRLPRFCCGCQSAAVDKWKTGVIKVYFCVFSFHAYNIISYVIFSKVSWIVIKYG